LLSGIWINNAKFLGFEAAVVVVVVESFAVIKPGELRAILKGNLDWSGFNIYALPDGI
jgi:hypothetical protein